ncbi:MAG: MBL fold metallo-hydrolase [Deltaproteobacteria bacterium]|nr:MBL fold metallo-hydrolase [Deltaproteobacteria bacterium]
MTNIVGGCGLLASALGVAFFLSVVGAENPSDPAKSHHTEHGFRNPDARGSSGFISFLKWRWDRLWKPASSPESYRFPLASNDPAFLKSNRSLTTVTWIGHATLLVQLAGKNILTDPLFSDRASPFPWVGPKRAVPPGLPLERLPEIDVVVISHSHYDSLDTATMKKLLERPGGPETLFFVPLGLKSWFQALGVARVIEMDWWEKHRVSGLEIIAVPAHHWSKRGLFDGNKTLWAGWVIRSENFSLFFAGDSGYTPIFREIGRRLGPFDVAAIPIGAYEPRWFMRFHHMNPDEAVQVHRDVAAKMSVGIHWGTFVLSDEPLDEPPMKLAEARAKYGLSEQDFRVLQHGQTIFPERATATAGHNPSQ